MEAKDMVRKAIIPIAGRGTRLHPLTKVVPKAMLPLPAGGGRLLPVIHWICSAAHSAGVEQVLLVASPSQRDLVERYLDQAGDEAPAIPGRIDIAIQAEPEGFGDAVLSGADFVGNEPFLLLLGDHVYRPAPGAASCPAQVVAAFARHGGAAMVGMQPAGVEELCRVGVAAGEPVEDGVYRCADFAEKPGRALAESQLRTPGLEAGTYLAHCGIYVFDPEIFDCLNELAGRSAPGRELELADAQAMLLQRRPDEYFLCRIDGRAYDIGTVKNYTEAVAVFSRNQ